MKSSRIKTLKLTFYIVLGEALGMQNVRNFIKNKALSFENFYLNTKITLILTTVVFIFFIYRLNYLTHLSEKGLFGWLLYWLKYAISIFTTCILVNLLLFSFALLLNYIKRLSQNNTSEINKPQLRLNTKIILLVANLVISLGILEYNNFNMIKILFTWM